MTERLLRNLGLMRRANALSVGEDNTGAAARAGKAKLLLLAADASDNARKRAESFCSGRGLPLVPLPFEKADLSAALGLPGCSMAAVTDMGFAAALLRQLQELDNERYGELAEQMRQRGLQQRGRRADPAREKTRSIGKRRTKA